MQDSIYYKFFIGLYFLVIVVLSRYAVHDIDSTPVLVVGGSLVGLSAAVFLARQGVPVVLVEKHAGSSAHPRAIGYTTRTLELFRAAGVTLPTTAEDTVRRGARG